MIDFRAFLLIFSWALISCSGEPDTLFERMSPDRTGVQFKNLLRETEDFNVMKYGYFYNGGGVAIGDVNNDGLADIYFTGNLVASRLYINKGNWKFEEVAEEAGVSAEGLWNTGTAMADINGDGWLDIYVCRSAAVHPLRRENLFFINDGPQADGKVHFSEMGALLGVADQGYSTQAAFLDYDRDGDLDLYVLNHSIQEYAGLSRLIRQFKEQTNSFYGDKLYRNELIPAPGVPPGSIFTDVTREAGILTNVLGFGLGVSLADFNRDGWLDIYVSNDYNENDYCYINQQNGTFKEQLTEYFDHVSLFSMGADIGDINNDGLPDLLTLDMLPEDNFRQKMTSGPDNYDKYQQLINAGFHHQTMRNMLQVNQGDGTFSEVGQLAGISNTDWSWAALFADFDLDGWQDLFVTNGYERDYTNMDFMTFAANEKIKADRENKEVAIADLMAQMPPIRVPNYIYKNNGDLSFTKMNGEWGFEDILQSHGTAYGDLDGDGDLDLAVNNVNEPAALYQNHTREKIKNHFLRIKLIGAQKNAEAVGAEVCLLSAKFRNCQTLIPTRGFQSSVEPILTFGLGQNVKPERIEIKWPTGETQIIETPPVDTMLTISQGEGLSNPAPIHTAEALFTESELSGLFVHRENPFVDFKVQPLLPHFLSTQGPKIATADVNGDQRIDFFIGGAKGSAGKIFLQTPESGFFESTQSSMEPDSVSEDIGAEFFDADGDGDPDLYVVSGGYDFAPGDQALQDRLYLNSGKGVFIPAPDHLPEMKTSGSCVAAADMDGDGDLDLFVGGRLVPGNYPAIPESFLLENDGNGYFKDVTQEWSPRLRQVGMVTDALWTDVDGDQLEDLVVVGEWMPVTVFLNQNRKLKEATAQFGTQGSEGWWNTVISGDFDGDGDQDLVAGNFGWNSQIKVSKDEPATLYAKDFDQNGSVDPILCYYIMGQSYPMPSKDDLLTQLPYLKDNFVKYETFAKAKIEDIFSAESLKGAAFFEAFEFSSVFLENQSNKRFSLFPLPIEAQVSPLFAVAGADINGDGSKDLILGGNLLGTRVKFGHYDANHGVVLSNKGKGNFFITPPIQTGLRIKGEVRDMALVDLANGEKILLVARNNDALAGFILKQPGL